MMQYVGVHGLRERKFPKELMQVVSLRLLQGSTKDSVPLAVYPFLSSMGLEANDPHTAYVPPVGLLLDRDGQ